MDHIHIFTADVCGDRRNTVYPHACEITTLADLLQAAKFDHTGAAFKDNRRSNDGFLWADCLIADVDNAAGAVVQPARIARDLPDVQHYILYSRHNMTAKGSAPAVPRFHVVFPIARTRSREYLEGLKRALCRQFPYYDGACVDVARFFFGTEQPQGEAVYGLFLLDDVLDAEDESPAEEPAAAFSDVVPEGSRNNTLSAYALTMLKRLGADDGQAREQFDRRAAQCVPPLNGRELETIWAAAVRAYRNKVQSRPDYLTPEEYELQGLQPDPGDSLRPRDFSSLGEARAFTADAAGRVLYTEGTGWLCWDGKKFAQSEAAAHLRFHAFTDRQLLEARREVHAAVDAAVDADELTGGDARQKKAAARGFIKFVQQQRNTGGIAQSLKEAAHIVTVDVETLDADPFLLNTPGGAVDLRTGQIRPNDPADRCTKVCAVDPGTDGAELWREFVGRFTCGDAALADYLQRVAGAAAVGHVYSETLVIAYGTGGNGKSTFFNVLARVLGDYSGTLSADALTANPNRNKLPELAELRGKRLVLAAELEEGTRLDTSMLKRLCSTDAVHAEPKYKQPFTFIPSHTTVLFTNFLPKVGSSDAGTWSRLVVVPCRASFRGSAGEVKDYAGELFSKAGGAVLSWIIEGARRFIENGFRLNPPPCVWDAVKQYKAENDWLQHFLDECCIVGENYSVGGGQLLSVYRGYCLMSHEFTRRQDEFKAALLDRGFFWKKTMKGAVYYGLKLNEEYF